MRKLIILLVFCSTAVFGQQEPQFTQFWNSMAYFNPATGAQYRRLEAFALGRLQWMNISGYPKTGLTSFMSRVKSSQHSVGGSFMHDNIGFTRSDAMKLSYAYHLKLGIYSTLSFGVSAGVKYMKNSTDIWWCIPPDPSFFKGSYRFIADFGVAFHRKGLDVGLSATQLPQSRYINGFQDQIHVLAFAGYTIPLTRSFNIRPQVFFKSDLNFNSLDMNVMFQYKEWYAGATYRSRDALGFIAGWDIKHTFRVTYSTDLWFSKLNNGVLGSTHELGLGFIIKERPKHLHIISPPNF